MPLDRDHKGDVQKAETTLDKMLLVRGLPRPEAGFDLAVANYQADWVKVQQALDSGQDARASRIAWGIVHGTLRSDQVYEFFVEGARAAYDDFMDKYASVEALADLCEEVRNLMADLDVEMDCDEPNRYSVYRICKKVHGAITTMEYSDPVKAYWASQEEAIEAERQREADRKRQDREAKLAARRIADQQRTQQTKGPSGSKPGPAGRKLGKQKAGMLKGR